MILSKTYDRVAGQAIICPKIPPIIFKKCKKYDMPFDVSATREMISRQGFSPACQAFFDAWLAACANAKIPRNVDFAFEQLPNCLPYMFNVSLPRRGVAIMTYIGSELNRISGSQLAVGDDWFKLTATKVITKRIGRAERVASGYVLRNTREVLLASKQVYFFDTITVPIGPDKDGVFSLSTYFDWCPPNPCDTLIDLHEIVRLATVAEFFPLVRTNSPKTDIVDLEYATEERSKIISRAAIRFLLNMMGDLMRATESEKLDPLDLLIALAVGSANLSHIDNDRALTRKYIGQIEPDTERRGISRAAISRATQIPLETVRRRINNLVQQGVLLEGETGIILPYSNRPKIGARSDLMRIQTQLVMRLYRDIRSRGFEL